MLRLRERLAVDLGAGQVIRRLASARTARRSVHTVPIAADHLAPE